MTPALLRYAEYEFNEEMSPDAEGEWVRYADVRALFTPEDVAKLRKPPELYGGLQNGRDDVDWYDFCYSLADRIAALLPPA